MAAAAATSLPDFFFLIIWGDITIIFMHRSGVGCLGFDGREGGNSTVLAVYYYHDHSSPQPCRSPQCFAYDLTSWLLQVP